MMKLVQKLELVGRGRRCRRRHHWGAICRPNGLFMCEPANDGRQAMLLLSSSPLAARLLHPIQ